MKWRCWAGFESDLPTDLIEDDDRIIQNGGKSVAEAVSLILEGFGLETRPVKYAGDHGWDFLARLGKRDFFCSVLLTDQFWMLFRECKPLLQFGEWPSREYLVLLEKLSAALVAHPRFHQVAWFDEGMDFLENGRPTPIDLVD